MLSDIIKNKRKELGLTLLDIAKYVGVSEATVQRWESGNIKNVRYEKISLLSELLHVTPAEVMGWDDYNTDYSRYKLDESSNQSKGVLIPVLGYVRAGIPIEAVEEILDYEEISSEMARQGDHFALRIKGDSMEPKFSADDVVIVRKQEQVDNGEIAVVLVNGDNATVKKFYKSDNGIKLISTNPLYDPLFYTPDEVNSLPVTIVGKVVELRAKF